MNRMMKTVLTAAVMLAAVQAQAATRAVIETDMGNIELSLDEAKAPKTVANFVEYAKKGFYNNTIFHRTIDKFMIQGGGFTADMVQKPAGKAINSEADNGLKNTAGTIAMARLGNPNSATSQFFINTADNDFLNFKSKTAEGYGYAVFGRVVKGMDVVEKIGRVKTTTKGYHQDVPVKPVVIKKIVVN